jgi:hypothetical protein
MVPSPPGRDYNNEQPILPTVVGKNAAMKATRQQATCLRFGLSDASG